MFEYIANPLVRAYAVSRLEEEKEQRSRSELARWVEWASGQTEEEWALRKTMRDEFGEAPFKGPRKVQRDLIVGRYLRWLPKVSVQGTQYEHPYSLAVELAALRAHRDGFVPFGTTVPGEAIAEVFERRPEAVRQSNLPEADDERPPF